MELRNKVLEEVDILRGLRGRFTVLETHLGVNVAGGLDTGLVAGGVGPAVLPVTAPIPIQGGEAGARQHHGGGQERMKMEEDEDQASFAASVLGKLGCLRRVPRVYSGMNEKDGIPMEELGVHNQDYNLGDYDGAYGKAESSKKIVGDKKDGEDGWSDVSF